jgi:hypothetical protein
MPREIVQQTRRHVHHQQTTSQHYTHQIAVNGGTGGAQYVPTASGHATPDPVEIEFLEHYEVNLEKQKGAFLISFIAENVCRNYFCSTQNVSNLLCVSTTQELWVRGHYVSFTICMQSGCLYPCKPIFF